MVFYRLEIRNDIMGRKLRTIAPDTIYHVVQRGNNRKFIFEETNDKGEFFEILKDASDKYDFKVLYYVVMDNHYHLLLESSDTPIWQGIKNLNLRYSKYFNKKYVRTGTIYEGRYSARVVASKSYFYQVVKYLAMNPVLAGLVKDPGDYPWSAHKEVVKGKSRVIDRAHFLSYFSDDNSRALKAYLDLIKDGGRFKPLENLHIDHEIKTDQLFEYIVASLDFSDTLLIRLKRGDRDMATVEKRVAFVLTCYEAGISTSDIADYLSYSAEGVRAILRRADASS